MKFLPLLTLFISIACNLFAQSTSGSCTGNAEDGKKTLLPGEKERIITYYIRHDFTLETDSIFDPYIYSVSFNHAFVEEPFIPCQEFRVNPEIQPPGFEGFAKDTIIDDQVINNLSIIADSLVTELSTFGGEVVDSAFAESCNSKAKANTCIYVDSLQADQLSGTIQSYGFSQAIEPTTNNDAYAFSWSGVTIEDGQPIKSGSVTWEPQLKSKIKGKSRSIRQKAGTNDPVMFYAKNHLTGQDTSATLLSVVMRFQTEDDTLEVENYWENNMVHIESDSLLFRVQFPSFFTVQQGFIYLLVKDGQVIQSLKSGIFITAPLPPPGTQVPFTFPLNNYIHFDYNMDATSLFGNDSMTGQLFMYGNPENNFVRTYDSTKLIPHYRKPSCPGMSDGRIELIVNYGTPPYNYFWSNGNPNQNLNGVSAGTYTVMVIDFFGQTASAVFTLTDPQPIDPNASVVNVTCKGAHDGIIILNPSGGIPPYTYLWNNGNTQAFRTGLYPKTHTVTVTDSKGCLVVSSYSITQPANPMVLTTTKKNLKCGNKCNGFATVTPSGGVPPYSFIWNTGHITSTITNLCAGTYTCTVTDTNGCVKTKTVILTQNPPLTVTAIPAGTSATAVASGGIAPYTFYWFTAPPQISVTATGLNPGSTYKVKVTDSKGCTATHLISMPNKIAATTGRLFPNPTTGIVNIVNENSAEIIEKIIIRDQTGKAIITITNQLQQPVQIDLGRLTAAVYYAEIYTSQTVYTGKIIRLSNP